MAKNPRLRRLKKYGRADPCYQTALAASAGDLWLHDRLEYFPQSALLEAFQLSHRRRSRLLRAHTGIPLDRTLVTWPLPTWQLEVRNEEIT